MIPQSFLQDIFYPIISKYKDRFIHPKSATSAIRSILGNAEARALFFIAKQQDEEAYKIVRDYSSKVLQELPKSFFVIVMPESIKIVKRPSLLMTYKIDGDLFLAISERILISFYGNKPKKREIASFHKLPNPFPDISFEEAVSIWNCSKEKLDLFISAMFSHNLKPQEQLFQTSEQNFLIYDKNGYFRYALPKDIDKPLSPISFSMIKEPELD